MENHLRLNCNLLVRIRCAIRTYNIVTSQTLKIIRTIRIATLPTQYIIHKWGRIKKTQLTYTVAGFFIEEEITLLLLLLAVVLLAVHHLR